MIIKSLEATRCHLQLVNAVKKLGRRIPAALLSGRHFCVCVHYFTGKDGKKTSRATDF